MTQIPADVKTGASTLTVTLVSLLEGDYNSNGTVEQADLDLVLLNWGDELFNPFAAGWINDLPSGPIDEEELDKVLLNWGMSVEPLSAASVPEPSGFALFVACLVALALNAARGRWERKCRSSAESLPFTGASRCGAESFA